MVVLRDLILEFGCRVDEPVIWVMEICQMSARTTKKMELLFCSANGALVSILRVVHNILDDICAVISANNVSLWSTYVSSAQVCSPEESMYQFRIASKLAVASQRAC